MEPAGLRTSSLPARAALVLAACALSMLLHGYKLEGGDNDAWIPFVRHAVDPALYPGDPLLESRQPDLSFHVSVMAALSRLVGLDTAFFLAYLVLHVVLFAAVLALAEEQVGARAAPLALALLAVPRPVGGTATTTLEVLLLPRLASEALGLAALAFRRRPAVAGLLLGLALLVHPIGALPFVAAHVGGLLAERASWRDVGVSLAVLGACGLALVPRVAGAQSAPLGPDPEWMAVLRESAPYAFLQGWSLAQWLFLAPAAAALLLPSSAAGARAPAVRRALLGFVAGAACLVAVAAAGEALQWPAVVQLQGARGLVVVAVLGLVKMAGWLVEELSAATSRRIVAAMLLAGLLPGWLGWTLLLLPVALALSLRPWSARSSRVPAAASLVLAALAAAAGLQLVVADLLARPERGVLVAAAALAALGAAPLLDRPRRHLPAGPALGALATLAALLLWKGEPAPIEWPWGTHARPGDELRAWARAETPRDARFLVPREARGFRAFAERASLLEPCDAGPTLFSKEYALRWRERSRALRGEPARLLALGRAGAFDYLVLTPRMASEAGVEGPVAHADAGFVALGPLAPPSPDYP